MISCYLECTDAAPRPAHPRPTRRRGRDAADRTSVPRRATWQVPNRADEAKIGADEAKIGADAAQIGPTQSVSAISACIGRNGRVRPKFKKKKKKVQMHRLTNLNTQTPLRPSHFVQNSQRPSLTPPLISLLCVLSLCSVPHLYSLRFELSVSAVCTLHCFSLQVCSLSALFLNFYSLFFTISL